MVLWLYSEDNLLLDLMSLPDLFDPASLATMVFDSLAKASVTGILVKIWGGAESAHSAMIRDVALHRNFTAATLSFRWWRLCAAVAVSACICVWPGGSCAGSAPRIDLLGARGISISPICHRC